ncbi:MAG: hypothetical protein OEW85_06740 [Acidimicrobiia bacterium]|nr:hypothetical protein [Acidimicrobiia bacterium]
MKQRAVRMVLEHQDEYSSQWKAICQRLTWSNGNGDGTVALVSGNARLEIPLGIQVVDLTFGDLDGNDRPEAIVARFGAPNAEIRVLRNNSFIAGDPL